MGLASIEAAMDAEKFYSDYVSTTEAETQDKMPATAPAAAPKKVVRKKKKTDHKPTSDSESEEEVPEDQISNYNISFQADDQILNMFTLGDENNILSLNFNPVDGVFESASGNLVQSVEDSLSTGGNMPNPSIEKLITIDMSTINQTSNEPVQREIFDDEDQPIETAGDTLDQTCCKSNQKVLNKIDYLQKKWSKEFSMLRQEFSLFRQENRETRQLLLQVLNAVSPNEGHPENIHNDQMEASGEAVAEAVLDMAELDKFNARYKETFPISSSDFFIDFNKSLKDDDKFANSLFAQLSEIKGEDETKTARKILKELCNVRCLKDFTWQGTKKMKCFQDLHLIIEMISKLLKKNMQSVTHMTL